MSLLEPNGPGHALTTRSPQSACHSIVYTVTTRVSHAYPVVSQRHISRSELTKFMSFCSSQTTAQSHLSRSDVSVLRRFSDFLWLFTVLQNNNPGVIVPPVPDKHPFGAYFFSSSDSAMAPSRQSIRATPALVSLSLIADRLSDDDSLLTGRFAEDFVESRRLALEQCLQKMANHPVLQLDPDLRLFLESDTLSAEVSIDDTSIVLRASADLLDLVCCSDR